MLLEAGKPHHSRPLLQSALQRCPLQQLDTAELVIGLLLEAERQLGASGSWSKPGGQYEGVPAPTPAGSPALEPAATDSVVSDSPAVQRELRLALEALGRWVSSSHGCTGG